MTYVVTARKWRPQLFEDVVGQAHVATTLRNAIAANRLSHAYIFSGPRGVGKTTTARILAKAINCPSPKNSNPDNTCDLCTEITEGRSVNVFEIDGASNRGVDEIRNLREAVRYPPAKGKYKVYIIDEVHMLTKEAFNALLKTLEEPPPHILFIFATTEIHKVPLTILSRCQRFDFRRIPTEEIVSRLLFIANEEHIPADREALMILAKKADGSMRDAQSIFDQSVSYCGDAANSQQIISMLNLVDQELFFRVTDLVRLNDAKGGLALVEEIVNRGYDSREFLTGLSEHLRNLLVAITGGDPHLIEAADSLRKRYMADAEVFRDTDVLRLIAIANETDDAIRRSQQPRYALEVGILKMIKMDTSVTIEQLLQQLNELKKKLNGRGEEVQSPPSLSEKGGEPPVRGSVKASLPALRPDQIVSGQLGSAGLLLSSRPAVSPRASLAASGPGTQERPSVALSLEEASGKWPLLIDETRRQRIHLGTMLSESTLVDVHDNSLCVGCPDDFHLDALTRNREFISDLARKIYGAKIRLQTVLSKEPPLPNEKEDNEPAGENSLLPRGDLPQQHPVIQALIREFGAKPVD